MASYDDTATVSGSVVSIENGADEVGAKSCVVTVRPTLTGTSEVVEKQTGRNLLNYADVTNSYRITSLTDNGDGSFTAVASGAVAYIDHIISVKAGQEYSIKCKSATNDEGNASQIGAVNVYDGSDDTATLLLNGASIQTRKGFTPTGNYILVRNKVSGGYGAGTGTIVEPQLELGSTAHAYEPYQTPTVYTASLGRTIYGGTADVVKGTGKETYGIVDLGTLTWTKRSTSSGHWRFTTQDIPIIINDNNSHVPDIASVDYTAISPTQSYNGITGITCNTNISQLMVCDESYSDASAFSTAMSGKYIVYPLIEASQTDFTFTPITPTPETALGTNNFWSEQGDSEVTYYKDGYGFTSVTVNKTGRNLLDFSAFSDYSNWKADISANQSFPTNASYRGLMLNLPIGTYTISFGINSSSFPDYLYLCSDDGSTSVRLINFAQGQIYYTNTGTFTIESGKKYFFRMGNMVTEANFNALIEKISWGQIELGSTAHDYEPYEAVTKTAKFHRIVYGGQADVVRGTCEPKNLLKVTGEKTTYADITYTVNDKGQVMANGTATALRSFKVIKNGDPGFSFKKGVTYTLSGCPSGGSDQTYQLDLRNTNTVGTFFMNAKDYGNGVTFTPTEDAVAFPIILVRNGQVCDNLTFNPQIEISGSKTEYAPHFDPFSFPPIYMETDEGENTLFANEGASAITYRKETD